jgi:SPX domain protein involved in polyphosphate accumulation
MAPAAPPLARYRYERKFLVPASSWSNIQGCIKLNPGMFSGIFRPRTVNNIYLDSASLRLYFRNLEGAAERTKVRIRWYGDLFGAVSRPVLEFKIKRGLLGTKVSFALKPFTLDSTFTAHHVHQALADSELPAEVRYQLAHLQPTLVNRYQRAYYQSADANYRITLDSDLEFLRVRPAHNTFLCKAPKLPYRVLELKFDQAHWEGALEIANALPFRVTRISKYVHGLDCLDGF